MFMNICGIDKDVFFIVMCYWNIDRVMGGIWYIVNDYMFFI